MPDNKCAGGCGNAVTSMNTCKICLKHVHPGCLPKHRCQPAIDDSILQSIKQLQNSVDAMARELKEQRDEYAELKTIVNEVRALREENSKLKEDVKDLNNRLDFFASQNTDSNFNSGTMNRIVNEINDRNLRQNNIIMFDIPEPQSNEVTEDLQKVREKN